jgi:hypothetical protein
MCCSCFFIIDSLALTQTITGASGLSSIDFLTSFENRFRYLGKEICQVAVDSINFLTSLRRPLSSINSRAALPCTSCSSASLIFS